MPQDKLAPILRLGSPLPKSIGRCADLLHDVRALRLDMEKQAKEIADREAEIKAYIVATVSKSDDTGAAGLKYRVQVVTKRKPILTPEGWAGFTSWMNKHDRFDMIQKRLSDKPILEYEGEQKKLPPGLEGMNVPDLSLTKI